MKKLYIMRHAKAGQTNKNIRDDHERPLTDKGMDQCAAVGSYLKSTDAQIGLVFSSTAKRTQETTELVLEKLDRNIKVVSSSKLYLGSAENILNELLQLDEDDVESILIVGHNPGLHQFALLLIGGGNDSMIRSLSSNFLPSTLATLEFPCDSWSEIKSKTGQLTDFLITKTKHLEG